MPKISNPYIHTKRRGKAERISQTMRWSDQSGAKVKMIPMYLYPPPHQWAVEQV
jgi:hypothetical protein